MVVNGKSRDDVAEMLKSEGVVDVSSTQDQRRVTSQLHVHPSVRPSDFWPANKWGIFERLLRAFGHEVVAFVSIVDCVVVVFVVGNDVMF